MQKVDLIKTGSKRRWSSNWTVAAISVGCATIMTFLVAILGHLRYLQIGKETHLTQWILGESPDWFSWALLVPLIIWLGKKVRVRKGHLRWTLSIHFVVASMCAVVTLVLGVLGSVWAHGEVYTQQELFEICLREVIWMAPWSFFIYTGILSAFYAYEYRRRYNERELATSRLETELTKAQLDSLYSQLQPHFLFNTLNSISVLMRKGDIDNAQRMLNRLSELLRYVLAKENTQEVTLQTELGFVEGYLDIEQTRFGDRLQVSMNISADSLQGRVPSFILQMLVENAVRHGLASKAGTGHISIEAARDNGHLRLTVADDGIGIAANRANSEGVGLRNTRSRLVHLYGEQHRFEVVSPEAGGTVALLEIPYQE